MINGGTVAPKACLSFLATFMSPTNLIKSCAQSFAQRQMTSLVIKEITRLLEPTIEKEVLQARKTKGLTSLFQL